MKKELLIVTLGVLSLFAVAEAQQGQGRRQGGGPPKMDETTRAAFESCAKSVGMPDRSSGTRPTQEQHEKFKACLSAAGIEMPDRPPRHGGGGFGGNAPPPPPEDNSDE